MVGTHSVLGAGKPAGLRLAGLTRPLHARSFPDQWETGQCVAASGGDLPPERSDDRDIHHAAAVSAVSAAQRTRATRIGAVLATLRSMPWGVRVFLLYALLILAGLGVSLPYVIALAVGAPVSFPGLVVMILLAYTIFTVTLVLQRKEAARQLALLLAAVTFPTAILLLVGGAPIQALFFATLGAIVVRGLTRPDVRAWLSEP